MKRGLRQDDMAERAGVTRKTYRELEQGGTSSSLALLVRSLTILGYRDMLGELLAADPIGDELAIGKAVRVRGPADVADF
jgi:transcriptional regulator with XRE-family HTH domain